MPSFIYNRFKINIARGLIDISASDINIALVTSAYAGLSSGTSATATDTHYTWGDVSATEVSGTGYTTGGYALSAVTLTQNDTTNAADWDCADITWSNSTIDAWGAVIYKNSGTKPLIMCFDFNGKKSSYISDFKITINTLGLMNIV